MKGVVIIAIRDALRKFDCGGKCWPGQVWMYVSQTQFPLFNLFLASSTLNNDSIRFQMRGAQIRFPFPYPHSETDNMLRYNTTTIEK